MIKALITWFSQFDPFNKHHSTIKNKKTSSQRNSVIFKYYWKQGGAIWLFLTILTALKGVSFENILLINCVLVPLYILTIYIFIKWLSSIYSPIPKYRLKRLLKDGTEELNLIRNHNDSINQTKWVKWEYWIENNNIFINCYLGGFITDNFEKELGHKLTNYLIKITGDIERYNLIDNINDTEHGRIKLIYGKSRERRIINSIENLKTSKKLMIQLDSELFINNKTLHTLLVGPTRSGKTTLMKTLLISSVALNPIKNRIFICDGKNSYLASVSHSIKNSRLATTPKALLSMLDEICLIMNNRYKIFTDDPNDERDITYCELRPNEGLIFFFFDEVLALYSEVEASDKLLKPTERILPQIQARVNSLLQKGAAANISVIMAMQQAPAYTISTAQRSAFGCRIACGRIDDIQAQEIFGLTTRYLPYSDTSDYSGVIWLDGQGWNYPKTLKLPYFDDNALPFKATLRKITGIVSEAEKA